jgi:hypothetical protein
MLVLCKYNFNNRINNQYYAFRSKNHIIDFNGSIDGEIIQDINEDEKKMKSKPDFVIKIQSKNLFNNKEK